MRNPPRRNPGTDGERLELQRRRRPRQTRLVGTLAAPAPSYVVVVRFIILGVATLAFAACGEDAPTGRGDVAGSDAGGSEVPADTVLFEDVALVVSCAQPAPGQLAEAVELDDPDARFDGVRQVTGERPTQVLALHAAGNVESCPDAEWVLAFGQSHLVDEAAAFETARLRCLVPEVPDDERCVEGGPFWFGTDPTADGTAGDGRSAVWVEGTGPEPPWRSDPLEVVAGELDVDEDVVGSDQLRRVGLRVVEDHDDEKVVEVLYQNVSEVDGQRRGSVQREHHTVSRLRGRDGWYLTGFIVAEYAQDDIADAELDAMWNAGLDRVLVDVDRRPGTSSE
jgi:hypothetical protein